MVVDPLGSVEQANPAARRLLGVVPAAEPPVPWYPPQPLKSLISDVLAGRGDYLPLSLEQAIPLADGGQERYFLPRVVAIRAERDELIGAAVALVDVTKFHLLDRLKSDMVSTVSHELKTPLTSVQMAVHLLLEEVVGPLTPKQVELLLAARQDADRILAMINDLLDLTRIEQGRVKLDLQPVAAAELVDEAVARMQPQAAGRAASRSRPRSTATTCPVMVDRDRIEHVFDNLIVNAIQHTPRGGSIRLGGPAGRRRTCGSTSATRAKGSPPSTCRDLREVLPHPRRAARPAAPGWAWRSSARSSPLTAARSTSAASRARGRRSPSPSRRAAMRDEPTDSEGQ